MLILNLLLRIFEAEIKINFTRFPRFIFPDQSPLTLKLIYFDFLGLVHNT